MDTQETKELLQAVKHSLDGLLLRDRAQLNALMRRVRQRIHDRQPADKLVSKLKNVHINARYRSYVA